MLLAWPKDWTGEKIIETVTQNVIKFEEMLDEQDFKKLLEAEETNEMDDGDIGKDDDDTEKDDDDTVEPAPTTPKLSATSDIEPTKTPSLAQSLLKRPESPIKAESSPKRLQQSCEISVDSIKLSSTVSLLEDRNGRGRSDDTDAIDVTFVADMGDTLEEEIEGENASQGKDRK